MLGISFGYNINICYVIKKEIERWFFLDMEGFSGVLIYSRGKCVINDN